MQPKAEPGLLGTWRLVSYEARDPQGRVQYPLGENVSGLLIYFGSYTIDHARQIVTHHVRGAWYPNWIGRDQVRHFKFDAGRLLLSTPPMIWNGQSLEYVLTWERIS